MPHMSSSSMAFDDALNRSSIRRNSLRPLARSTDFEASRPMSTIIESDDVLRKCDLFLRCDDLLKVAHEQKYEDESKLENSINEESFRSEIDLLLQEKAEREAHLAIRLMKSEQRCEELTSQLEEERLQRVQLSLQLKQSQQQAERLHQANQQYAKQNVSIFHDKLLARVDHENQSVMLRNLVSMVKRNFKSCPRVAWQEDYLYQRCQIKDCNSTFDHCNRRHHCRGCGCLVCGNCSREYIPFIDLDVTGRACILCVKERNYLKQHLFSFQEENEMDRQGIPSTDTSRRGSLCSES